MRPGPFFQKQRAPVGITPCLGRPRLGRSCLDLWRSGLLFPGPSFLGPSFLDPSFWARRFRARRFWAPHAVASQSGPASVPRAGWTWEPSPCLVRDLPDGRYRLDIGSIVASRSGHPIAKPRRQNWSGPHRGLVVFPPADLRITFLTAALRFFASIRPSGSKRAGNGQIWMSVLLRWSRRCAVSMNTLREASIG